MLSKQQKLRYGEELRRQMKQRQEKKRFQQMEKRGFKKSPTDTKIIPTAQDHQYQNSKEDLQKRFESDNHAIFGRPGGGAPNRNAQRSFHDDNAQPFSQPTRGQQYVPESQPYYPQQRTKTHENYQQPRQDFAQNHSYTPYQNQGYPPQLRQKPTNTYDMLQQQQGYDNYRQSENRREPQNYRGMDPRRQPDNYKQPDYYRQQPVDYYRPQYQQQPQISNHYQRQPTQRSMNENPPYDQRQGLSYQQQPPPQQNYQQQAPSQDMYSQPMQEINQKHQAYRQKTMENQQLMEIHKKGGRNLLLLQNMTVDQQQIKQKQKQQIRKQLETQMRQAQQRKKRKIQQQRRQEQEEERKNQEYLLQQKMKLQEEERKKNEKQRQIIEQNVRNLEEKKRLQEQAKQKARRQKMKASNAGQKISHLPASPRLKQKQTFTRQAQNQLPGDETTSEVSSSTVMQNGFKTDISKQFFEKQRRKNQQRYARERSLQLVTDEIQRLKDQIDNQNKLFKRQIQKVKMQSQMAQHEKLKAQREIQDLKNQLKRKMQDDNERLFKALQMQSDLQNQQDNYDIPVRNQGRSQKHMMEEPHQILRPDDSDRLVKRKYNLKKQEQKYDPRLEESNVSEDGLMSLKGDSKKIPINLPNDKLSMSKLSDYARETQFFKNEGKMAKKGSYQVNESIVQEDQQRGNSRAVSRKQLARREHKDQLDKMLQSRQNSKAGRGKWGQLSSVNDDAIHQIDMLLKGKDKGYNYNNAGYNYQNAPDYNANSLQPSTYKANQRPSSNLSNAGKRALSRHGLQYEGASLNTINSKPGSLHTLDIDNINNRNEARLNQFRKMGVQTINTSNDGDLTKLDEILNRYKQGKSRVIS